jgi:hypothetical protein
MLVRDCTTDVVNPAVAWDDKAAKLSEEIWATWVDDKPCASVAVMPDACTVVMADSCAVVNAPTCAEVNDPACVLVKLAKLDELTLSNDAIWEREYSRPQIKCVAARRAGGNRR